MSVSVYLLWVRASRRRNRLGSCHFAACQREFHAKKGAQHRDGVVAPQSSMTPNDVLWHPHDPIRYAGVAGIFKFPLPPEFLSRRRMDITRSVFPIATGVAFMTIVVLARVK